MIERDITKLKSLIYPKGFTRLNFTSKNFGGFTIVELLVVIVVIGILAAITIISYTGISHKAEISSLQSDLTNGSMKLKMYQVEYGSFPQAMTSTDGNVTYCPTPTDTRYCIKPSSGNTFTYSSPTSPYQSFILDAIDTISTIKYRVTNDSAPVSAMPLDTVTIGTQTWMKYNLDVGTMITGTTAQTNNSILEKYCYNNDPANCTIYGGLYQWGETVQYQDGATNTTSPSPAFTGNIQGIAPAGFHIPTDVEWKTLEMYLGMTQAQADALWSRGTTEGDQLKNTGYCLGRTPCGTSGFNGLLGGNIYFERTSWQNMGETTNFWSSSDGVWNAAWRRYLYLGSPVYSQVNRGTDRKIGAFSIRCLKN